MLIILVVVPLVVLVVEVVRGTLYIDNTDGKSKDDHDDCKDKKGR